MCSVSFSPNPLYSTCWCSALRRDVFVAGRPVRRRTRRDSGRPGRSCGGAGATGPLGRELPYKTREPRNTKSRGATTRPNPHPNRTIRTLHPCLPDVPPHDTRPPPRLPPFYPCGGTGCNGVHLPPFLPDPKVERAGAPPVAATHSYGGRWGGGTWRRPLRRRDRANSIYPCRTDPRFVHQRGARVRLLRISPRPRNSTGRFRNRRKAYGRISSDAFRVDVFAPFARGARARFRGLAPNSLSFFSVPFSGY